VAPPESRAWAEALGTAAAADMRIGGEIAPHFERARAAVRAGVMSPELARALASIGGALALRGRPREAREALAILDGSGMPERDAWVRARCHHLHGFLADVAGEPERVAIEFDASLALAERLGDARAAVFARLNAGYGRLLLGAWEEAEERLRRTLDDAGRAGVPLVIAYVKCNLAHALWRLDRHAEAAQIAEEATAVFDAENDRRFAGAARMWRAEIARTSANGARAIDLGRHAVALLESSRGLGAQAKARLAIALIGAEDSVERTATVTSDVLHEAVTLAEGAKRVLDEDGPGLETGGEIVVRLAHARTLSRAGRKDEARDALGKAHARLMTVAAGIGRASWRQQFLGRPWENIELAAWAAREGFRQPVYNRPP
jgi:tetratricopeptide (TPR) repeat protein